jgi:hypothetical protein
MFGAISIVIGGGLMRNAILRRAVGLGLILKGGGAVEEGGDLQAIRRVLAADWGLGYLVATPIFIAGIAFGFITAITGPFDLTAPWLVIAYVLLAGIFVNGLVFYDPYVKKIKVEAENSDGEPSPQVQAMIRSPRLRFVSGIHILLVVAIIFTMIVKPFS